MVLRVRFLLVALCVGMMVSPSVGWNPFNSDQGKAAQTSAATQLSFVGRLLEFWTKMKATGNRLAQQYARSFLLSVSYGIMTVVSVKIVIWLVGFDLNGVRKDTIASYYVRRQGGHVIAGSWLSIGQSLGASGLGVRLGSIIFLIGAVIANLPSRNV